MSSSSSTRAIQQPKPQVIPGASTAAILVSTRQKGNPILTHIRNQPWEYADIPADYVLGATTCVLFLSLKYHKLHPEYIYGRIRALVHRYNLRIVLVMVDIEAHEQPLKELSKTSLINDVTIILAWSVAEAGRYLELFKTYEHAAPTSIKGHQSTSFSDRLVEFVTIPRSVNKTDALGLVSNFGTIRTSINAQPEEIALIAGWGEKKVQRWSKAVREPFRSQRASRKILSLNPSQPLDPTQSNIPTSAHSTSTLHPTAAPPALEIPVLDQARSLPGEQLHPVHPAPDQEESLFVQDDTPCLVRPPGSDGLILDKTTVPDPATSAPRKRPAQDDVDEGILSALAKLRKS